EELNATQTHPEEVRLLSRHLAAAVLGAAACHIGLEDDPNVIQQVNSQLPGLRQATGWVFQRTVGKDPARYLAGCPGVTLQCLAELFRQAQYAGAIQTPKDCSPAAWFEEYRQEICGARLSWFRRGAHQAAMHRELLEAVAIVEETNRVQGMETLAK